MEEIKGIPFIIVTVYLVSEIYKVIFKKKSKAYKLIPVFSSLLGGILGGVMYLTSNDLIMTSNVYNALLIGIVSGSSATGTNQIIKQLILNKEEKEKWINYIKLIQPY